MPTEDEESAMKKRSTRASLPGERKLCLTALVLVCAAVAIPVSGQPLTPPAAGMAVRVPLESKVVKGAPYAAEIIIENTQSLADGNRIVDRTTGKVYRDSEGRVRREDGTGPGKTTVVSITDPAAGVSFSLFPGRRVALQTPAPMAGTMRTFNFAVPAPAPDPTHETLRFQWEGSAPPLAFEATQVAHGVMLQGRLGPHYEGGQPTTETLPGRLVEGVWAQGTRRTTTIEAGAIGNERPISIVSEEWFSPELQVLVVTEHSDPRVGTSTYRLANIHRIEPERSLFEVPVDYTIRESGVGRIERPQGER
jgi:hypothetical protein